MWLLTDSTHPDVKAAIDLLRPGHQSVGFNEVFDDVFVVARLLVFFLLSYGSSGQKASKPG